ncbi:hypothetical protein [Haloarcula amylovorans]|uniref:hypothetical protein n=1 Tax=Haloarcula amylovorans TaxID=2562280 RepID=UPI00107654F0|nr:hypothetical protein [Halomicroarcula amylolytica]
MSVPFRRQSFQVRLSPVFDRRYRLPRQFLQQENRLYATVATNPVAAKTASGQRSGTTAKST